MTTNLNPRFQTIRAIYRDGVFYPLDPVVGIKPGTIVTLTILDIESSEGNFEESLAKAPEK